MSDAEPVGQHVADSSSPGRPFAELMDSGLLWLINASVFHPRGLALAIALDPEGNAAGWQLLAADAGEAYRYAVPYELDDPTKAVDVDDLFRRVERTMAEAQLVAWSPNLPPAAHGKCSVRSCTETPTLRVTMFQPQGRIRGAFAYCKPHWDALRTSLVAEYLDGQPAYRVETIS